MARTKRSTRKHFHRIVVRLYFLGRHRNKDFIMNMTRSVLFIIFKWFFERMNADWSINNRRSRLNQSITIFLWKHSPSNQILVMVFYFWSIHRHRCRLFSVTWFFVISPGLCSTSRTLVRTHSEAYFVSPYIIQFPSNYKLFWISVAQAHFKVWSSDFDHYLFATSKEIPSFENSSDGIDCGKSIRFLSLRLLSKWAQWAWWGPTVLKQVKAAGNLVCIGNAWGNHLRKKHLLWPIA